MKLKSLRGLVLALVLGNLALAGAGLAYRANAQEIQFGCTDPVCTCTTSTHYCQPGDLGGKKCDQSAECG